MKTLKRNLRQAFVASVLVMAGVSAASQTATPDSSADAKVVPSAASIARSPAELKEAAWVLLSNGVTDQKHADVRTQALAALGSLGNSPRSLALIQTAMSDRDVDIRGAAASAAELTKAPAMTTPLRQMLDDKEPPVAFAAAVALWKMKDYSGEDVLMAVADGDRASASGIMSSAEHSVNKDFHHPGGIAKFAAMQGAGMLLGPFGYGITAYEYLHKNGGDVARVTAIELLAQNRTTPIRQELVAALMDKDPGVRLAAAKALSTDRDAAISAAIAKLFDDEKSPVRLTAAATYLIGTGAAPGTVPTPAAPARRRR